MITASTQRNFQEIVQNTIRRHFKFRTRSFFIFAFIVFIKFAEKIMMNRIDKLALSQFEAAPSHQLWE